MARFAVGVSLSSILATFLLPLLFPRNASAQNPAAGILPFSTHVGGQYDSIDLATSDITLNIPLRSKPGKIPFAVGLIGNSGAYLNVSGTQKSWVAPFWLQATPLAASLAATVSWQAKDYGPCNGQSADPEAYGFVVTDPSGAAHGVPITVDVYGCIATQATATTSDGSGFTLSVTDGYPITWTLYDKSGNQLVKQNTSSGYNYVLTDPDGVTVSTQVTTSSGSFTYIDTLGEPVFSGPISPGSLGASAQYTYTDSSGNSQYYTVTYTGYYQVTAFSCPGIADLANTSLSYYPTRVSTPTGASYGIAYEQTPGHGSSYTTGRVTKITYPSGGSVSYAYSGGNSGINCTSGVVPTLTRTVNDNNGNNGIWTYVNSNNSSTPGNFTVTETDPANNQTVYSFSGEYQTQAVHQGTSTVLKTVISCYGVNNAAPPTRANCPSPSSVPTLPITEVDTYTSLGGSAYNEIQTKMDPTYNNVTYSALYDWGATTPTTQAYSYYGQSWGGSACSVYPSGYVNNTPCYSVAENSAGIALSETKITYNNDGKPASVSRWTGASENTWLTTSFAYGANGAAAGVLSSITDVNNATTTFGSFQCNGMLSGSTTYPISAVGSDSQTWACNGGVVTQQKDVNGNTTSYTYNDPLWRLTYTSRPDGGATSVTYSTGSTLPWTILTSTSMNSTQATNVTTTFDGLSRTVTTATSDPNGPSGPSGSHYVSTTFDSLGRVSSVTNPYFCNGTNCSPADPTYGMTTNIYDALGRAIQTANPDGSLINTYYTNRAIQVCGSPCVTGGVYGLNRVYQADGLGRLVSVCDGINAPTQANGATTSSCGQDIAANGFLATYGYDGLGNLLSANYSGQQRWFAFDGLSRMTGETNLESGTTLYTYDLNSAGDLYKVQDARGVTSTYSYDAMHRVTGITFSDSTPAVTYNYDQSLVWLLTLTNGKGRLTYGYTGPATGITTGSVFSFDSMGRILDTYSCTPLVCPTLSGTNVAHFTSTYDFVGDRTSLNDHNVGVTLSYSYDISQNLTGITSSYSNSTNPATIVSNFSYNALQLPTGDQRSDSSVAESYSYDAMGRSTSYTAGSLYSLTLARNKAGNVTGLTDSVNGTWSFSYDSTVLHKLIGANCTANCLNSWAGFSWTYDQFGNRWTQSPTGGGSSALYTFNANNQILGSGVTYDAAGDMTADGLGYTFSYDALHRLSSTSGSQAASYIYDAFGKRVEENPGAYGAGQTDFVFDTNGEKLHRVTSTNNGFGLDVYAAAGIGAGHLGLYVSGNFYEEYQNQVGSSRIQHQYGSTTPGWLAELPFGDGSTVGGSLIEFDKFTDFTSDVGGEYASFTRRYSATQGRWQVPDPAGLAAVDPTNPQTWNRYAYVTNNPVNDTDPMGLFRVGPLAYAGYYTAGCGDMFGNSLADNCDFMNPFSGMQDILLEQTNAMLYGPAGIDFTGTLCGESVGLPCGLPIDTSIWNAIGISLPCQTDFGVPCESIAEGANNDLEQSQFAALKGCVNSLYNINVRTFVPIAPGSNGYFYGLSKNGDVTVETNVTHSSWALGWMNFPKVKPVAGRTPLSTANSQLNYVASDALFMSPGLIQPTQVHELAHSLDQITSGSIFGSSEGSADRLLNCINENQ